MAQIPEESIAAVERFLRALANFRVTLVDAEEVARSGLEGMREGRTMAASLDVQPPSVTRERMNDALKEIERSRHQVRLAVFSAGMDDGMTAGDLSRQFGFSRQLGARYVRELRSPD